MSNIRFAFRHLMKSARCASTVFILTLVGAHVSLGAVSPPKSTITAEGRRPASFPHRIWAACDFEGRTPDYGWFGQPVTNNIVRYPGNRTALAATERPYQNVSAVMIGINPVPGPRMGKENGLFLRYFLKGGTGATLR